jgi:DsbC/DsbD-like thiol-disulfide interchange protein
MFPIRSFMRAAGLAALLLTAISGRAIGQRGSLTATLAGGRTTPASDTVALRIVVRMTPGWHVGAEQPGKSGVPTRLTWQLPTGWRVVATRWSPPTSALAGRDTVFEYGGPFAIETTLVTEGRRRSGMVQALVTYGLCKDVCMPGRLTLKHEVR